MCFKVKLKLLRDAAFIYGNGNAADALKGFAPATKFSVGIDLRACFDSEVKQVRIFPGERLPVGTGVAVEPVNLGLFDNKDAGSVPVFSSERSDEAGMGNGELEGCPTGDTQEIMPLKSQTAQEITVPAAESTVAGFVYSRSGLGAKQGLVVAQGVGVIDPDYRGEIIVWLLNLSQQEMLVQRGDRIAQLIFFTCLSPVFELVDELGQTGRGVGGFGHTGK